MIIKPVLLNRELVNRAIMLSSTRWIKLVAVGGSAALASGAYYGYINYQRYNSISTTSAIYLRSDNMQLSQLPPMPITRAIEGPTKLGFGVTLFQYCSCPFCCKTRTFLDYFGVNYNIVEVNPVLRQQLKWSQKYKKVPVLIAYTGGKDADKAGSAINRLRTTIKRVWHVTISPVKAERVIQASESHPNFWIQPGAPNVASER